VVRTFNLKNCINFYKYLINLNIVHFMLILLHFMKFNVLYMKKDHLSYIINIPIKYQDLQYFIILLILIFIILKSNLFLVLHITNLDIIIKNHYNLLVSTLQSTVLLQSSVLQSTVLQSTVLLKQFHHIFFLIPHLFKNFITNLIIYQEGLIFLIYFYR
jgi:hypothetical protein